MSASLLSAAAIVLACVGAAHSVIGELLIFRHVRSAGWLPTDNAPPLRGRHIRILWASWHIASVFGLALAAILWRLSTAPGQAIDAFAIRAFECAALGSAALVFVATRGRHPGWIGLGAAGLLALLA
jgi:hypothetical protein